MSKKTAESYVDQAPETPLFQPARNYEVASVDRDSGIGGTDIAAILGMSPWRSPFDVWLSKTGQLPAVPEDNRKRWGKRLQRVIADAYAEETGRPIEWLDRTFRHPTRPFQTWSPDALCTRESRGLDAKTCGFDQADKWGDTGTNQVPDYVALQNHWYLSAAEDRDFWDVALLVAGSDFRIFTTARDIEVEGMILAAGEKFWKDHVLGNKAPAITATDTTTEWLKRRFPRNNGALRDATGEEITLLLDYKARKEALKSQDKQVADIEANIKALIGNDDGIKWGWNKVTFKLVPGGHREFDVPAHRRLHSTFKEKK